MHTAVATPPTVATPPCTPPTVATPPSQSRRAYESQRFKALLEARVQHSAEVRAAAASRNGNQVVGARSCPIAPCVPRAIKFDSMDYGLVLESERESETPSRLDSKQLNAHAAALAAYSAALTAAELAPLDRQAEQQRPATAHVEESAAAAGVNAWAAALGLPLELAVQGGSGSGAGAGVLPPPSHLLNGEYVRDDETELRVDRDRDEQ